jgi:single-strand DNA-binding protein
MAINKVILVGRLGGDPVLKDVGDSKVANFSLATGEKWKDKQGNPQEKTEWHSIQVWNKLAELAGQYLKKGREVYVEGKLTTRQWEKDGVKHFKTEVVAHTIQFLGGAPGGAAASGAPDPTPPTGSPPQGATQSFTEDDIPF